MAYDQTTADLLRERDEARAERDAARAEVSVYSNRLADLLRKSYGLAIDSDQDWVRAHINKTIEAVRAASSSRAQEPGA